VNQRGELVAHAVAIGLVCALAIPLSAQSTAVRLDTLGTPFTFPAFVDGILANHPVATQARLVADQARADLRTAWGAFDPTVTASWDQKTFGGTSYYNYFDAELKIPLPIGADVTIAFDRTMGRYFNPDRRTPSNGTIEAGISIPLGQRILTDERRNALQQARAARDAGDVFVAHTAERG
jgi:outer membrane protein TolC